MKKEDLNFGKKDLNFGNVVELKNGDLCLIEPRNIYGFSHTVKQYLKENYTIQLRNLKTANWLCDLNDDYTKDLNAVDDDKFSIMKVYNDYTLQRVLWTREKNNGLLTDEERKWLKEVIKPFKDKVDHITLSFCEYLRIYTYNDSLRTLNIEHLTFDFGNLEREKKYTPEELGL